MSTAIPEGVPTLVKKTRPKSKYRRELTQALKPPQISGQADDPSSVIPLVVWVAQDGVERRAPCTQELYARLNPNAPGVGPGTFSGKAPHRMRTVSMTPFRHTLYFEKREGAGEVAVDMDMVGAVWRARSEAPERFSDNQVFDLQILPQGSVIVETAPIGVAEADIYRLISLLDEHERIYEGQQLTPDGSLIVNSIRGRKVEIQLVR